MSMHNDYLINILAKQQHAELLERAAQDRLARELPGRSAPWWRRLVDGRHRPRRSRLGHGASRVPAVPLHGGICPD
jgi:hypothetical protein